MLMRIVHMGMHMCRACACADGFAHLAREVHFVGLDSRVGREATRGSESFGFKLQVGIELSHVVIRVVVY